MAKAENFDLAAALQNNPDTTGKYKGPVNRDMDYENEQANSKEESDRDTVRQFREGRRKEKAVKNAKEGKKGKIENKDQKDQEPVTPAELIKEAVKQEANPTPERQAEIAQTKVEIEKGVEDAANQLLENPQQEINILVSNQTITREQGSFLEKVMDTPQAKRSIFGRIKESIKDGSAAAFIGGVAAGTGVRVAVKLGALAAFGASIPVLLGAGAAAGAGIEGIKAAWRESKTYDPKEIMDRFNNSGYLEKAAMLGKLEDIWSKQKFDASPQEYQQILQSLYQARTEMQIELDKKDGKFANLGDREKVEYILRLSQDGRNSLETSNRSKEAREIIKSIEKSLDKNYSSHKLSALKGKWGTVAKAAGKGALFGLLGSGIAAGVGAVASEFMGHAPDTVTAVAGAKAEMAPSFTAHLDHRGITGGARDALHDFINEQRGFDPNFANGVTVEQLVYAEDTLAKEALRHGVSASVHEMTWTHDQLLSVLEKANVVGGNGTLTQGGMENIHHIIGHKPHFLSEATRAAMMNFTPDQVNEVAAQFVSEPGPLIMTATDFATMNSVLLATSLAESLALQKRQEARQHLEYIKTHAQVIPDSPTGSDYSKFPGWPSKATKPKTNEKFPQGAPPSPHNKNVEETPIAKPDGTPFDRAKNEVGQETKQESGITEEEFNKLVDQISDFKKSQPKLYLNVIKNFKKFSEGKVNNYRKEKYPNLTDVDFKRLLDKLEDSKAVEKSETGISKEEFDSKVDLFKKEKELEKNSGRYQELIRLLGDFSNGKVSSYRKISFKNWTDADFSRLLQELGEVPILNTEEPSKKLEPESESEIEPETEVKEGNKDEITPNSIDERFKKAGFKNVKVVRWPKDKITKKQKEKIDELSDLFMQSLTALKESEINNQVILDFYQSGSKVDLSYTKKKFYVGIPLNNKPYSRENFYAIGDWMLESKVNEIYNFLKTDYKFRFKEGEQKRFNKLTPANQYRAYKKLLAEYENRKSGSTKDPKLEVNPRKLEAEEAPISKPDGSPFDAQNEAKFELNISQEEFDKKLNEIQVQKTKNPTFYKGLIGKYNNYANGADDTHRSTAFKGWSNSDFKQLLENVNEKFKPWDKVRRAKLKDTTELDPDTKDLWEVNDNISQSEAFLKFPIKHRLEANRIVHNLIQNNFKKGFPTNIRIEFSDRFKTQPGKMTIDLSRLDEKYINGQIRAGIRQANPDRWLDADQKVIDRYDRRYPQQQSEQQRAIDQTAERFANKVVSEIFPYAESPELEEWLDRNIKKPGKISDSGLKKFNEYFESHTNDWVVDQAKSILDSGLQKTIPETDDEEFIRYIKSETLENIADALNKGGEVNIGIANELRNKYAQFEKDAGDYRREKRRIKK